MAATPLPPPDVVTVTLNPALDRTLTIGRFTAGAVNRVALSHDQAGGKGVNVAAALAGQGHRVTATGFLGAGNSAPFEALFAARRIADAFIRLPGETRIGLKIADPVLNQTTDINFPGLAPSAADLTSLQTRLGAFTAPWCVLAGSLPPGVKPGFYHHLIAALRASGVQVGLDTSGSALREALSAGPAFIKPNLHELEALVGRPLPTEAAVISAARALVAGGIGLVVVSRGADGACFVTAEQTLVARPPAIAVRSTVGAGDAMVAGLVSARLRGLSLADTARLATAFSVHALTRTDAETDAHAAIEAILPRVAVATP